MSEIRLNLRYLFVLMGALFAPLYVITSSMALDAMPPGSLKAFVISSENPRYIERWTAINSEDNQQIHTETSFAPGETAYTAVIVTGYTRDAKGRLDLDAGFRFFDHTGKLLFRRDAYAKTKQHVVRKSGFIMLDPALDIGFDPQDPAGNYLLEFEVNDNISHHRTVASIILTLNPLKYSGILKQRIDDARVLDDLWRYYDQSQDPQALKRLISVLHWSEKKRGEKKILGDATRWSIASRTRRSPEIRSQCRQLFNDPEIKNRVLLEQILGATSPQPTAG